MFFTGFAVMDEVWLGFEHGFGYSTLIRRVLRWRTGLLCDGETSAATGGRFGADLIFKTG